MTACMKFYFKYTVKMMMDFNSAFPDASRELNAIIVATNKRANRAKVLLILFLFTLFSFFDENSSKKHK